MIQWIVNYYVDLWEVWIYIMTSLWQEIVGHPFLVVPGVLSIVAWTLIIIFWMVILPAVLAFVAVVAMKLIRREPLPFFTRGCTCGKPWCGMETADWS
jgi:hypothetical protein